MTEPVESSTNAPEFIIHPSHTAPLPGFTKPLELPAPRWIRPTPDPIVSCTITDPRFVQQTFLELTSQTCPGGDEAARFGDLMQANGFTPDGWGNYYIVVGDAPGTMFTSHMDDVSSVTQNVTHRVTKNGMYETDKKTILGADCKAGMAVMLYMINAQTPGLYVFFREEESGRIGAELAVKHSSLPMEGIDRCVSFDRRGYTDIITKQMGERCCSPEFAEALAETLNALDVSNQVWAPDPTGSFTDSAAFTASVSECTNLSVGYHHAHTHDECIDLDFLQSLAEACSVIEWDALPAVRVPVASTPYSYYGGYGHGYDWGDDDYEAARLMSTTRPKPNANISEFVDEQEDGFTEVLVELQHTKVLNLEALETAACDDWDTAIHLLGHLIEMHPNTAADFFGL
jgi:hypothetical protein